MRQINKNNIDISKISTPEDNNSGNKFIPQDNIFSLDELLDTFMYVHPSKFSEYMVEIEKKNGCVLLFPSPKKIFFKFRDDDNGEYCIVDYLWNDVLKKEDL
ncbi:MAG: hypothetical protein PF572_06515 [Patescibacteria group bacterium]|jgi:hypothetical protein|nr:hypothetical protein [Patescibacteria group bacterium]